MTIKKQLTRLMGDFVFRTLVGTLVSIICHNWLVGLAVIMAMTLEDIKGWYQGMSDGIDIGREWQRRESGRE